jgi:hypothetical protein
MEFENQQADIENNEVFQEANESVERYNENLEATEDDKFFHGYSHAKDFSEVTGSTPDK